MTTKVVISFGMVTVIGALIDTAELAVVCTEWATDQYVVIVVLASYDVVISV